MKGKTPKGSVFRKEKAKSMLKGGGYAKGGATGTGEPDDCPTKDNPTCKKSGGPVSGAMPKKRLDKPRRYATGGGVDGDEPAKKKSGAKTQVNIIIQGKDQSAPPLPPPIPPGAVPAPMPPAPPAGGPPPGAPMPPPPMHKRGGAVKYPISDGAGGGKGRLEKAAAQKSDRPKKGDKG